MYRCVYKQPQPTFIVAKALQTAKIIKVWSFAFLYERNM